MNYNGIDIKDSVFYKQLKYSEEIRMMLLTSYKKNGTVNIGMFKTPLNRDDKTFTFKTTSDNDTCWGMWETSKKMEYEAHAMSSQIKVLEDNQKLNTIDELEIVDLKRKIKKIQTHHRKLRFEYMELRTRSIEMKMKEYEKIYLI